MIFWCQFPLFDKLMQLWLMFRFFLKSICSLELNIYVTLTQTFQAIEEEVGPKLLFVDFWLQHLTSGADRLG